MLLARIYSNILNTSVMVGVLIMIILLIKWIFRRKLSPKWHYYIWFIVLIKMILPYGFMGAEQLSTLVPQYRPPIEIESSDTYADGYYPKIQEDSVVTDKNETGSKSDLEVDNMAKRPVYRVLEILALVWILGFMILFIYILYAYFKSIKMIGTITSCEDEDCLTLLRKCESRMGLRHNRDIYWSVNDNISPCVIGFIKPKLIISKNIYQSLTPENRDHTIMHELVHIKRRDNIINAAAILLNCIHWFNPLIWYAMHRMRIDCEIACDFEVTKTWEIERRRQYGNTLIHTASLIENDRYTYMPIGMSRSKKDIKRRLEVIMEKRHQSLVWIAIGILLIVGLASIGSKSGIWKRDIVEDRDGYIGIYSMDSAITYRLVKKKAAIYEDADKKSDVLPGDYKHFLVEVLDETKVGRTEWLKVRFPVYDTPGDDIGWIQKRHTAEYTKKNRRKVVGDIYIEEGTPYYELREFHKDDREPKVLDYDRRGRIEERSKGYVKVFTPGAFELWVKEKDVKYPPIN